ncbi:hypothetical protein TNCV_1041581 [Trichonephila clavipes]|nr:hypothetical protein TNCV_1041581 [Trichonephila clavipes]
MGLWSGREKKKWDDKKVENREGSLGYPRFVKPVFTKDVFMTLDTQAHEQLIQSGGQSEVKCPVSSSKTSLVLI